MVFFTYNRDLEYKYYNFMKVPYLFLLYDLFLRVRYVFNKFHVLIIRLY